MKHILFLTWKDITHPNKGGAEIVIHEYMKYLVMKGYKVTWFASGYDDCKGEETIDGINIIRRYRINSIYFQAHNWYKEFKKTTNIDLIIDEAGGIPLLSPLYENQIPITFFIHHIGEKEWDYQFPFPLNKLGKYMYFQIIKKYKDYPTITVSQSTKDELVDKMGFNADNITIIENTLNNINPIKKINFDNKENNIVYFGRVTPIKRVEDIILALVDIKKDYPNCKLNIIGNQQDTNYIESLNAIIEKNNLTDNVVFHGYLEYKDLSSIIQQSKAMIVTSYKEGYGLVVLEGNAYGLPVIGYNVGGLRDSIIDGKNGILINDGNIKQIGEKVVKLFDDKQFFENISKSSLEHVKSVETTEKKAKLFEQTINKYLK